MKFKGSLVSFRFDLAKYQKRLHDVLSNEIAHAAFTWLETVLSEIPTWSGASRATFLRLAREVEYALQISPKDINRIPYGQRHGEGSITADPKKGVYNFHYSTDLRWLVHNEFNSPDSDPNVFSRLLKPGPYFFQKKGQEAFRKFASEVRLPSPWKNLKVTRHRVK
jgi:hypothetical protein